MMVRPIILVWGMAHCRPVVSRTYITHYRTSADITEIKSKVTINKTFSNLHKTNLIMQTKHVEDKTLEKLLSADRWSFNGHFTFVSEYFANF